MRLFAIAMVRNEADVRCELRYRPAAHVDTLRLPMRFTESSVRP
jgi:hypothetical protein